MARVEQLTIENREEKKTRFQAEFFMAELVSVNEILARTLKDNNKKISSMKKKLKTSRSRSGRRAEMGMLTQSSQALNLKNMVSHRNLNLGPNMTTDFRSTSCNRLHDMRCNTLP